MLRERVLKDFPNWNTEKQLSELQAYRRLGDNSPLNNDDLTLMETIINNVNIEITVECDKGVCEIVSEEKIDESKNLQE